MSRAPDFSSIDASIEIETLTFDFGRVIGGSGLVQPTTIINSATVTCTATLGLDPNASSRLVGSPILVASLASGFDNQAVAQQVGSMIAGEVYRMDCLANCSDGQKLNVWAHLPCNAIGP